MTTPFLVKNHIDNIIQILSSHLKHINQEADPDMQFLAQINNAVLSLGEISINFL